MNVPGITQSRLRILETALEENDELQNELLDITLCAPWEIARTLRLKDYRKLSSFIPIPFTSEGKLDVIKARKYIADLLETTPAFRSCDSETVCKCIAAYFMMHPEHIAGASKRDKEPSWFVQVSGENTPTGSPTASPSHSPIGSPRISRPWPQQRMNDDD